MFLAFPIHAWLFAINIFISWKSCTCFSFNIDRRLTFTQGGSVGGNSGGGDEMQPGRRQRGVSSSAIPRGAHGGAITRVRTDQAVDGSANNLVPADYTTAGGTMQSIKSTSARPHNDAAVEPATTASKLTAEYPPNCKYDRRAVLASYNLSGERY